VLSFLEDSFQKQECVVKFGVINETITKVFSFLVSHFEKLRLTRRLHREDVWLDYRDEFVQLHYSDHVFFYLLDFLHRTFFLE
jgi:hypothetical protein